jgi:hypothetical protein
MKIVFFAWEKTLIPGQHHTPHPCNPLVELPGLYSDTKDLKTLRNKKIVIDLF